MIFYISIDSFDNSSSCTSYQALKLLSFLKNKKIFLHALPRIVRLNRNIRWKTRGNGAILLPLIHCSNWEKVKKIRVGLYQDSEIYLLSSALLHEPINLLEILNQSYEHIFTEHGDRAMAISEVLPNSNREYLDALKFQVNSPLKITYKEKCISNRGLVGVRAALSSSKNHFKTFELRAYGQDSKLIDKEKFREKALRDRRKGFYGNYDFSFNELCCVVKNNIVNSGLLSYKENSIEEYLSYFEKKRKEYLLFKTNQRKNHHLVVFDSRNELKENVVYLLSGAIVSIKEDIKKFYRVEIKEKISGKNYKGILFKRKHGLYQTLLSLKKNKDIAKYIASFKNNLLYLEGIYYTEKVKRKSVCCLTTLKKKNKAEAICISCKRKFPARKTYTFTKKYVHGAINSTRELNAINK